VSDGRCHCLRLVGSYLPSDVPVENIGGFQAEFDAAPLGKKECGVGVYPRSVTTTVHHLNEIGACEFFMISS
jgi:hypothetical protein